MSGVTLMEIYALHAATDTALETGLLEHLSRAPSRPDDAARALGLDAVGVARVLEVLRSARVIELDDGRYVVGPELRRELEGPGGSAVMNARVWAQTPRWVRGGHTLLAGGSAERGTTYAEVVSRLGRLFAASSERLRDALAAELGDGARILDVGAGSGIWSLPLIERRAGARVTALDLESVVPRFLESARERGLADRVDALPGDYFSVEVPRGAFDAIVVANVLHLEPPERARALVARLAGGLRAGGRMLVVDAFPSGAATDRRHAAYALHLGLRLPGARPHHEPEVRSWLSEQGLGSVARVALEPPPELMAALIAGASEVG